MRKILLFTASLLGFTAMAQTYSSAVTAQQDVTSYGQTFTFTFTGLPAGGWGNGTLVVYYNGDFGDSGEYGAVTDEDTNPLGQAGPYPSGFDCDGLDSVMISFDATMIDTWMGDGQVDFFISPSSNVDPGVCTETYFQCRLVYNYCAAGTPVQMADFSIGSGFCNYDNAVTLTGTPAGGTFSGDGVTGNSVSFTGMVPGSVHTITYTATDAIGCTTTSTQSYHIKYAPAVTDTVGCEGGTVSLHTAGNINSVWYTDAALTDVIDTNTIVTSPTLTGNSTYYVVTLADVYYFTIDSLGTYGSAVTDINSLAGDDRGGIAVTPTYIYMVGDNNTYRANVADFSSPVSLPIRDAIFSDLATGQLYSFWSTTADADPNYNTPAVTVDAIRMMDEDLNFGTTLQLSQSFPVDYGSVIYAGKGMVAIRSGADNHTYVINLSNLIVTDLGTQNATYDYGAENWSSWGILEYDGTDYSGIIRSGNTYNISRTNFTTGTETDLATYSDLSDMSSLTYSPWLSRWYFHYEGSGQFGGSSETLGYAGSGDSTSVLSQNEPSCYSELHVMVNTIDLGADTTACEYNTPVMLFAGNGYESYTWNGVNNNYNVYAAMNSGQYVVEAVDSYGCTVFDTINVTLSACLGLTEQTIGSSAKLYPNPTVQKSVLEFSSEAAFGGKLTIFDVSGKIVDKRDVQVASGQNAFEINLGNSISGLYFVSLSEGNTEVVRLKLIVQ